MQWRLDDQSILEMPAWPVAADLANTGAHADAANVTAVDRNGTWFLLLAMSNNHGVGRLLYCCFVKRWIDAAAAAVALILLTPVWLIVSLAIMTSMRGSVVFRQVRIGQGGNRFVVYKFRTMIPDRRERPRPYDGVERRLRHKSAHDPRVTTLGRFLRRTSLDETPQLINVVLGDMALVGPRPELVEIVDRYEPWQHYRHLVRPGLTGWWQVQGRSDRPMHEHTDLDLHYIEQMSLGLDIRILFRTLRVVIVGSGAF